MATVNFLSCSSKQTSGGLTSTLNYCEREAKTAYDGKRLVTGINCNAENAYTEMMCTKEQYDKTDGRMYYHLVQSFHPDEKITPEEAHKVACEFAESQFKNFEVVVATHVDAEHIHSHFVINSVSFEDGKKYHSSKNDLQKLRDASDEICKKHGLSVVEPKSDSSVQGLGTREYRSALKDQSFKITLSANIIDVMTRAKTRDEFIELMEERGYKVAWADNRKYITYTTPDGKKCRDNKLHERRFCKEVMSNEFRIREQIQRSREQLTEKYSGGFEANSLRSDYGSKLEWSNSGSDGSGQGNRFIEGRDGELSTSRGIRPISQSDNGYMQTTEARFSWDLSGLSEQSAYNEEQMEQGSNYTGWETERELCFSTGGNEETNEDLVLDSNDTVLPDVDIDGLLGALASVGGSSSDVDEEDKMHKHYVSESKDKEKEPDHGFKMSM